MTEIDIRSQLEPLELLDLSKCTTVGKTVEQMEHCAIGARMIGEAARTMMNWIGSGKDPMVIYDDPDPKEETFNLGVENFAKNLQGIQCGHRTLTAEEYTSRGFSNPIIVLGHYPKRWRDYLFERGPGEAIFVNDINRPPSWVRDGYFRGFVNADPRLILPILFRVQEERIGNSFGRSICGLIEDWKKLGGVAYQAAHGFETFRRMIKDPDCTVIGTFAGIMTIAKMGGLMAQMVDCGWLQAIFTTGAIAGHGLVEGAGMKHWKYNPAFTDQELAEQKLNRITDCIEPEENLDRAEEIIRYILNEYINIREPISPTYLNYLIGEYLVREYPGEISVFSSAYAQKIPIFIPAFVDSELGNDVLIANRLRVMKGQPRLAIDCELDSEKLIKLAIEAKKLGIFSIGGGVPRNNAANVAPLIEIINTRLKAGLPEVKYLYGCRICPDQPYLGHLSGCTYSENASWRKMDTVHGRFSEVMADATMVFPFYMAAMKELQEAM